jgi:NosR/NirI family transcriptional regulator, nitrous oxide reductase regulator
MSKDIDKTIFVYPPNINKWKLDSNRIKILVTFIVVVFAWFYGYLNSGIDVAPLVSKVIPEGAIYEKQGDMFIAYDKDKLNVIGYALVGSGPGYSGPIEVIVGVDVLGIVTGVHVVDQRETPGFFRLIENSSLISQFVNKEVDSNFLIGEGIDAISGATLSAEGIALATRSAIRKIALEKLDLEIPEENQLIEFGVPEIILILLFVVGFFGHRMKKSPWKKKIRWATTYAGIILIGFVYTAPLTIAMITSMLSGYWPNWHNNIYWYLLIGGVFFAIIVDGQNPYCNWFCPFGGVQEVLASLTRAKRFQPRDLRSFLTWFQRGLALVAIILGLAFRRPGVAGFEPFATMFDFKGITAEWIFLGYILLSSLVVYRPFCNYLCPMDPTFEIVASSRRWGREVWRKWRKKKM